MNTCPEHKHLASAVEKMGKQVDQIHAALCGEPSPNGTTVGLGEKVRDNEARIEKLEANRKAINRGVWAIILSCATFALKQILDFLPWR